MRFPLKLALSAVLAKTIAGELTHMAQTQQIPNELDMKSQPQSSFRQTIQTDLPEDMAKSSYPGYPIQEPVPVNVNQYSTAYNAEKDGIQADASNQYPAYIESTLPYNGYSGIVPYAAAHGYNPAGPNIQGYNNPGAFSVQSGFDGYLVPGPSPSAPITKKEVAPQTGIASFLGPLASTFSALSRTLPESPFNAIFGILAATVFGGGVTTLLCMFTPFCTITFPFLPFRSGMKYLAKTYVGPENAEILEKAIDKFASMQPAERANAAAKSDAPIVNSDLKDDVKAEIPVTEAPKIANVEKSAIDSTTK